MTDSNENAVSSTGHVPAVCTLGIDLASQPADTGACLIDWSDGRGEVVDPGHGELTDEALVSLMSDPRVAKVAIDAPFGWPVAFIDAVTTYRDDGRWLDLDIKELGFRATEVRVSEEAGRDALSVAMSNLSWPAVRCARLLTQVVSGRGELLDRSGAGLAVEVYPMAALRRWGMVAPGSPATTWSYKGEKQDRRAEYLAALRHGLGAAVAMSDDYAASCVDDDDTFDAFVSALVARAAQLGRTDPIPHGTKWLAMREGWIHLPEPDSLPLLAAG